MPRKKGTPKTGGRKKGTPNKSTAEIKSAVNLLVSAVLTNVTPDDIKGMTKDEQLMVMKMFLPYVLPKQTENKISLDEETTRAVKDSIEKVNKLFD